MLMSFLYLDDKKFQALNISFSIKIIKEVFVEVAPAGSQVCLSLLGFNQARHPLRLFFH